jgi:hypothetical protein
MKSGEWVGYYTYQGKTTRCPMHLTLEFSERTIRGAGLDNPGAFIITGDHNQATGAVSWQKQYVGKHAVHYAGSYANEEIQGDWSLVQSTSTGPRKTQGAFRLWPLPDDLYGDDDPLQEILLKEIARKG